jgi:predicted metalloprotease
MGGGLLVGGGGLGLLIAVVYLLLGGDPAALSGGSTAPGQPYRESAQEAERREFVSVVLADTEDVWRGLFQRMGRTYREPKLVLFTDSIQGACGFATAAVGPFYCPEDSKVYIDLGFFDVLADRLGAKGDFARAYVIAHEVGHHVQNLLGTMERVQSQRSRLSEAEYNRLSVRLELQADFYAGVWAHHARSMASIDEGDIREAIEAASAIGDDTLQRRAGGSVVPDSFTHGTSEQRVRWFLEGWKTGDPARGDTFRARL